MSEADDRAHEIIHHSKMGFDIDDLAIFFSLDKEEIRRILKTQGRRKDDRKDDK